MLEVKFQYLFDNVAFTLSNMDHLIMEESLCREFGDFQRTKAVLL